VTWAALAVPRGTPAAITDKLSAQMVKLQEDPAMREKLTQAGVEAVQGSTPAKAKAYVMAEYEKWGNIIRRANVKLD
jgi:tripartite-type tricarboxylate transporter receptor subunit TctC